MSGAEFLIANHCNLESIDLAGTYKSSLQKNDDWLDSFITSVRKKVLGKAEKSSKIVLIVIYIYFLL